MNEQEKKPSNTRMHNPDGMYASEARSEDCVTLRDIFANSAMQGIMSNSSVFGVKTMYNDDIARLAYSIADELLKQREL